MKRNLLRLLLLNALFITLICLTFFDWWTVLAENAGTIAEFIGGGVLLLVIYGIIMAIPAVVLWAVMDWVAPSGAKSSYGRIYLGFILGGLIMIGLEAAFSAMVSYRNQPDAWVYIVFWLFGAIAMGIMGHYYKGSSKKGVYEEVESEVIF